jgi:hypothetical protein
MQCHPFFRRAPGDPPRFFAYVVNGVIAAIVAAEICLMFHRRSQPGVSPLPSAQAFKRVYRLACYRARL